MKPLILVILGSAMIFFFAGLQPKQKQSLQAKNQHTLRFPAIQQLKR